MLHWPKQENSRYQIQRMEKQTPPVDGMRYKIWGFSVQKNMQEICYLFCNLPQTIIIKPSSVGYCEAHMRYHIEITFLAWAWHTVGPHTCKVSFLHLLDQEQCLYERHDESVDSNSFLFQSTWKLKPCGLNKTSNMPSTSLGSSHVPRAWGTPVVEPAPPCLGPSSPSLLQSLFFIANCS